MELCCRSPIKQIGSVRAKRRNDSANFFGFDQMAIYLDDLPERFRRLFHRARHRLFQTTE
jgi:hypothetical protein